MHRNAFFLKSEYSYLTESWPFITLGDRCKLLHPKLIINAQSNGSNIFAISFGDQRAKEMLGAVGSNVLEFQTSRKKIPATHNNMCKRRNKLVSLIVVANTVATAQLKQDQTESILWLLWLPLYGLCINLGTQLNSQLDAGFCWGRTENPKGIIENQLTFNPLTTEITKLFALRKNMIDRGVRWMCTKSFPPFGNDMWSLMADGFRDIGLKYKMSGLTVSHMEDVLSRLRCSTTTDKNKREDMSNVLFYIYLQHYLTWNRFDY